ncbi:polysaccharide ABC transporter ATP-binding protein [Hyphomicrobium facile]|uniref:Lipopolysaccharide transport system ATP-binding protein n=1 Tax=Hyphomicrobium facile TaxID=51670 RepID=A0A1I7NDL0_9HYPH|nr:polysaccharide ABC transporter ATP-binding protein [Hyphomicrobium facile]SFV32729.1 lipopolysaccharide transport system ATP-binding protein [Hyphomicrobium facile]
MTDAVIRAEGLGKKYLIGHQVERERYRSLRDVIGRNVTAFTRSARDVIAGRQLVVGDEIEEFWALKDVNFEIKRGEVVGIIGRNGAGKSTLLKILSRITEPSAGRVEIKGRVASLLEVGTGFHPELTGRENIYLNGAILGMTRAEIRRKFDEIVAFAEIEKFLDTPVKRYSSGMYVRLAFAVAAHLEPEILIIDEVLAVGDAEFQKKCLGKMQDVAGHGRTVLFVSHNMGAVDALCSSAMLLEKGAQPKELSDSVRATISHYLSSQRSSEGSASEWSNPGREIDHPVLQPLYFAVVDLDGKAVTAPARNDEQLHIVVRFDVRQNDPALNIGIAIFSGRSEELLWSLSSDADETSRVQLQKGKQELYCALPKRFLNEGTYRIELMASLHCREWIARPGHNSPIIFFEIRGGLSDSPYWMNARPGILAPNWSWTRSPVGQS